METLHDPRRGHPVVRDACVERRAGVGRAIETAIAAGAHLEERGDINGFEVPVVDDGSTDRTAEIIESMAATDHRALRLLRGGRSRVDPRQKRTWTEMHERIATRVLRIPRGTNLECVPIGTISLLLTPGGIGSSTTEVGQRNDTCVPT